MMNNIAVSRCLEMGVVYIGVVYTGVMYIGVVYIGVVYIGVSNKICMFDIKPCSY